jgi:type I restriction enzyme S subunit
MSKHWHQIRLRDAPLTIIDGDRGKNYPSQNDFFNDGYCLFLNTKNVKKNGFDFSVCQYITQERDELLRKGKLKRNDLILTTRGTIGNIAFYNETIPFENVRINSGMVIIRPNIDELDPNFNFYLFRKLQEDFYTFTTGSAQPQLPIKDLNKLIVTIPPLPAQRAIAATLSCLDEKIELNRRINANLEAQAQALFKNWFADFDPWGGVMPAGWRKGALGELGDVTMGQAPDGSSYNEDGIGTVFYQGRAEFGFRFPVRRLFTTQPKRMAAKGDVLISVGDLNVASESCCIGRGLAGIRSKGGFQSFIFYAILTLKQELNVFNGEGTVFGSINKNDMASLPMLIPARDVVCRFEELARPMDKAIETNEAESRALAAIRDALLPKLMSGEIEVEEIA